ELDGAVRADLRPGGDVDRDPRAVLSRELRGEERRARDRLPQERVAGDVQDVAVDPVLLQFLGCERRRDAAVGGHRPLAVLDHRDDAAGRTVADWAGELDVVLLELARDELGRRIVSALRDAARLRTERCRPGGDVRGLAAGAGARLRAHVVPARERLLES